MPCWRVPPTVPGAFPRSVDTASIYMKKLKTDPKYEEPVGIVISRGSEPKTTPRFSAYEWAPGPEGETDPDAQAA